MTSIEALFELVLADWRDAVHWLWLVLVVGICYRREGVFVFGSELAILELLKLCWKVSSQIHDASKESVIKNE